MIRIFKFIFHASNQTKYHKKILSENGTTKQNQEDTLNAKQIKQVRQEIPEVDYGLHPAYVPDNKTMTARSELKEKEIKKHIFQIHSIICAGWWTRSKPAPEEPL